MMFRFHDLPVRRKLILLILFTSATALLLVSGAMAIYEVARFRHALVRELSITADIVAANSAAALAFSDAAAAREILKGLEAEPGIVHACLFTTAGKPFAEYKAKGKNFPELTTGAPGHRFEKGYVVVFRFLKFGDDIVGSIGLRSDFREQNARLKARATIAFVALLAALLVALALSIKLQKLISSPVLELAKVAHQVTLEKNYSLRAQKRSGDEIGQLIEEFNQMLAQIEKRDADLRASEERFRQLAENINEVFWITDLSNQEIIYISPAYETIWGRTCESVYAAPQTWFDAIFEDDRERVSRAALQQNAGDYDETYRVMRPDGTIRWVHDRGFPVRDEHGNVYRIAGIAEDITKEKEATATLERVEANYQSIFENAIDGIFQTTPEGRYLAANPAMARMLGYETPEELIAGISNLGNQICIRPESRIELQQKLLAEGQVREFENQLYRKDGSVIWVNLNARIVRDQSGAVLYYEGTTKDITERKRAEETLRRTEEVYRRAITGAGAVPYARDYDAQTYLFIGEGIERLIGYAPHEMRSEIWQEIKQECIMMGETAGLSVEEAIRRVGAGEVRTWQCDMRVLTRDGQSRWISDVSVQNLDESGRLIGLMGILQDITVRKQAEKRTAAFSALASQLSAATTREEAAANILETAFDLIGWDCGFVRLYDPKHDQMMPVLTCDLIDGKRVTIPPREMLGATPILKMIMKQGAMLIDSQIRATLPYEFFPFGNTERMSTSMLYVPIRQGNQVIGVISIQRYTSNIYSKDDLELLQALSDHCSGALQRIKATDELLEAEANYRTIFEGATEGIFQTTPSGNYLRANPALAQMLGYDSPAELLANVSNIEQQTYVLPERRAEFKRLLEAHGFVQGFEAECYRKDGSKFWISINGRAVRDRKGTLLYYEGTTRDITARRHLEKQLIEISDREKSRMGQDLHDGLCQQLVRTAFAANLLEKDLAIQFPAQVEQAKKVSQFVDDAITQSRNLARGLYPVKLEVEGLHSAMQELAANICSAYQLNCEFEASESVFISDHAVATHLYRIAQEGAINAVKHASPTRVQIRLEQIGDRIQLTVSDDGHGIPASEMRANGMGLHIMNYRAGMIGASLKVEPQPGGGTLVSCTFQHRNNVITTFNPEPDAHH